MGSAWLRGTRNAGLVAGCVMLAAMVHARRVHGAMHDAQGMAAHMTMTELQPIQPGDRQRADAIVAAARRFADRYTDYRKALADGYVIFHPEIKQGVYHFTDNAHAIRDTLVFDPARPTSLLYERTSPAKAGRDPGYKLVGVMYTAPYQATTEELNRRVPLSIAEWHLHTNLCLPPRGTQAELDSPKSKFGLQGSIATASACREVGGTFIPHIFGWMVHVYPYETDPAKIWAAGMEDEHGMQKDAMPMGMEM
jgi:hypothetical protein